jgi:hypothetical protein
MATRYGKMPDEVIYAAECGWGHDARYAFNDAATQYVEGYERLRDETKWVTARRPPSSKSTYKKEVPANGVNDLFAYLGIDPKDVERAQEAKKVMRLSITDEMWDALEHGEWSAEPE